MLRLWMGTLLISLFLLSACGSEPTSTPAPTPSPVAAAGDLSAVKTYLLENVNKLKTNTAVEALEPIQVKGKTNKVPVYRVKR